MSTISISQESSPPILTVFISSLLVLGNVLGVGVLALPISAGLGGFFPALLGIIFIWLIMLFSAWLIAYRIDTTKKNFDIPSFFRDELGTAAKWIAIACNLLILYGVLVAYLSGIATMFTHLYAELANYQTLIMIIYFCILISLIIFGIGILRKGMSLVMSALWICFLVMIVTGFGAFDPDLLLFKDWKYLPVCLPIAVSAFHFHNIIPTVSKSLNYHKMATYKAIFIGIFLGLIINLLWVIVVLGTLPENFAGTESIVYADIHSLTANVPMSHVLQNQCFTLSALIFAVLSVTSSFITNGAGLFGFIRDLCYIYWKTENKLIVSCLSFIPPFVVVLIYPDLFLYALSLVGGVGEDVLFALLPGIIIIKLSHTFMKKRQTLRIVGYIMTIASVFVLCFVLAQKFGLITLAPPSLHLK